MEKSLEQQEDKLFKLSLEHRWLRADFHQSQRMASFAMVGGGFCDAKTVVWCEVKNHELGPEVDALELFHGRLMAHHVDVDEVVGMMTSRQVRYFHDVLVEQEGIQARCIATLGLSNALRVGDPAVALPALGTINILCALSHPLTDVALLEALSLVVEARTAAVMGSAWPSIVSEQVSTGTGTDCVVVSAPQSPLKAAAYAGKHTVLGSLIGQSVYQAVENACTQWVEQRRKKELARAEGRDVS